MYVDVTKCLPEIIFKPHLKQIALRQALRLKWTPAIRHLVSSVQRGLNLIGSCIGHFSFIERVSLKDLSEEREVGCSEKN